MRLVRHICWDSSCWSHKSTANFIKNKTHKWHGITCPWRCYVGCILSVPRLICFQPYLLLCCMQYHGILDHIVTKPNYTLIARFMGPIWGWQDPGGPHVGPMNFAIWGIFTYRCTTPTHPYYRKNHIVLQMYKKLSIVVFLNFRAFSMYIECIVIYP